MLTFHGPHVPVEGTSLALLPLLLPLPPPLPPPLLPLLPPLLPSPL